MLPLHWARDMLQPLGRVYACNKNLAVGQSSDVGRARMLYKTSLFIQPVRDPRDMANKNIDRDSSDEEGKRGPTIMRINVDMRNRGEVVDLGWNTYNLPIGPYADMFLTYISLVTCNHVPISYNNWKQVPQGHKEHIWQEITKVFNVPESRKK